jgi:putative peptide zinc metalloprotease protein
MNLEGAGMLAPLREELALSPGAVLPDGQPSHTLYDPVRNCYFQIDWPSFEVLSRWHLADTAAIAEAVAAETTLQLDIGDVESVARFLDRNQLLQARHGSAGEFVRRLKNERGSFRRRLLHNYLFFRIPLVKPDRWLERWAPRLGFLYSRRFLRVTLAALCLGLIAVYRQWEQFAATLVDTLSWSGMTSYAAILVAVKTLHELGHGITAKRCGCRVPAMGIAFLVLWPVAYTDTNDAWKLADRRQRLAIAAAGILTELAIAVWATLAWALLPEGGPRSIAFLLATTTWVSTLAINASPFMRFDGYFLLSDWLGMPNLHARAFALARWQLRERLFGLGETPPEHHPAQRQAGLILFAYATWAYRLVAFLGIAVLVYTFFVKALGIFLFLVEIGWFVLLPVVREFQVWCLRWPDIRPRGRARMSIGLALAALLLLVLPWPTRLATSGLLRPADQFVIYAPSHAQVAEMPVAEGLAVKAGTVLLRLAAPDLAARRTAAQAKADSLRWQAAAGAFDSEQRAHWQLSQEQLAIAEAELATIESDSALYAPVAPFDGVLKDIDPDLRPGQWLSSHEPVARLVAVQGRVAVAYLDEDDIGRVAVGDKAMFYADGPGAPVVPLEVVDIDADASRSLPEAELSSLYGGGIAVRERSGLLHPERPIFRINLKAGNGGEVVAGRTWRGRVVIAGRWSAPGWRYLRAALTLFRREAGF